MQSAALFITAVECAENASTFAAQQYMLGLRDAFEAVFRACHDIEGDQDAYVVARAMLGELSDLERVDLLTRAQSLVYTRRRTTVEATMMAVN